MGPRGQKDNPPSEKYRGRHTQRKDQGLGGIDNICYPLAQYKPPRAGATCKGRRRSPAHQVPALHQLGKQTSKIAKKKKKSVRDTLDKENKRELFMANGRAFFFRTDGQGRPLAGGP